MELKLIRIMLSDSGFGLAEPGELAIHPVSGDMYRVHSLIGPIFSKQGEPHQQAALARLLDPDTSCHAIDRDPVCEVKTVGREELGRTVADSKLTEEQVTAAIKVAGSRFDPCEVWFRLGRGGQWPVPVEALCKALEVQVAFDYHGQVRTLDQWLEEAGIDPSQTSSLYLSRLRAAFREGKRPSEYMRYEEP